MQSEDRPPPYDSDVPGFIAEFEEAEHREAKTARSSFIVAIVGGILAAGLGALIGTLTAQTSAGQSSHSPAI